jgi:hypothetical protein
MRATKRLSKLLDRFEDEIISKAEKQKAKLQVKHLIEIELKTSFKSSRNTQRFFRNYVHLNNHTI